MLGFATLELWVTRSHPRFPKTHKCTNAIQVHMRVMIDGVRPVVPPAAELPPSPSGRRLEAYIELMKVG